MDHPMTKEESYAERRMLFKNIWDTSMHVEEKDDVVTKPKIIKTLRLDEVDRPVAGKKKKQRIKNLRAVCNKLLDFCDRQDADDLYYEQLAAQGKESPSQVVHTKPNKRKHSKTRKIKKAKSMISPTRNRTSAKGSPSESKDSDAEGSSTRKGKRSSVTFATNNENHSLNVSQPGRKIVKNTGIKKNKLTDFKMLPSGSRNIRFRYEFTGIKRTPSASRQLLQIHKVYIC